MRTLYDRGLGLLPKGDFAGGKVRQARERFQWPLALAAAFLIFEFLLSEQRRQPPVPVSRGNPGLKPAADLTSS